jgi:hypothetical protein
MSKKEATHKMAAAPPPPPPPEPIGHPHTRAATLPGMEVRPHGGRINDITRRIKLRTTDGRIKRIADGT